VAGPAHAARGVAACRAGAAAQAGDVGRTGAVVTPLVIIAAAVVYAIIAGAFSAYLAGDDDATDITLWCAALWPLVLVVVVVLPAFWLGAWLVKRGMR